MVRIRVSESKITTSMDIIRIEYVLWALECENMCTVFKLISVRAEVERSTCTKPVLSSTICSNSPNLRRTLQ